MNGLKKFYALYCKAEEFIVASFIVIVTALVFLSAVARTIKHPINWAQDVSLLLFAWVVFLGADVALRRSDFVRVDMLIGRFSAKVQKFFYYLWYICAIAFLGLLVRYGIPLSLDNSKRLFQTLGISYSWATISVPVGSLLLIITIVIKLVSRWNEKEITVDAKEAI